MSAAHDTIEPPGNTSTSTEGPREGGVGRLASEGSAMPSGDAALAEKEQTQTTEAHAATAAEVSAPAQPAQQAAGGGEQPEPKSQTEGELGGTLLFRGTRIYAATQEESDEAVRTLEASLLTGSTDDTHLKVLGFDAEWCIPSQRGTSPGPVATVQLAADELAAVFQIRHCGMPDSLAKLLGQAQVLKVGVGAVGDARKLQRDYGGKPLVPPECSHTDTNSGSAEASTVCAGSAETAGGAASIAQPAGSSKSAESAGQAGAKNFHVRGILDLNEVALRVFSGSGKARKPRSSLAALCQELLEESLPKPTDVRCSNWDAAPLSEDQLAYAATDAWVGIRCFRALQARAPEVVADLAKAAAVGAEAEPKGAGVRKRPRPDAPQLVDATDAPKDLPPGKRLVYRLFHENCLTVESIAEWRGIQVPTVYGYLIDAVAAGYAYDLAEFGLTAGDQALVAKALEEEKASAADGKVRLKAVKEALPEHIEYWHIKLVQAHTARAEGEEGGSKKPEAKGTGSQSSTAVEG